jgi:hypothetical protein
VPDERDSPSAGWEEVYEAMGVSTDVEEAAPCPDCREEAIRIDDDRLFCTDHGTVTPAD